MSHDKPRSNLCVPLTTRAAARSALVATCRSSPSARLPGWHCSCRFAKRRMRGRVWQGYHSICWVWFPSLRNKRDFSRKSQIIPTFVYFTPSLMGFSLELGISARGQKTRMMGLPHRQKVLRQFSRLNTIAACDERTYGQTNRRTPHDSKDRAMQSVARVIKPVDETVTVRIRKLY